LLAPDLSALSRSASVSLDPWAGVAASRASALAWADGAGAGAGGSGLPAWARFAAAVEAGPMPEQAPRRAGDAEAAAPGSGGPSVTSFSVSAPSESTAAGAALSPGLGWASPAAPRAHVSGASASAMPLSPAPLGLLSTRTSLAETTSGVAEFRPLALQPAWGARVLDAPALDASSSSWGTTGVAASWRAPLPTAAARPTAAALERAAAEVDASWASLVSAVSVPPGPPPPATAASGGVASLRSSRVSSEVDYSLSSLEALEASASAVLATALAVGKARA
jgi:hypothetical protein